MELEEKNNSPPTSTNVLPIEPGSSSMLSPTPSHPTTSLEPNISLPDKFDGTRKHFRAFINQIKLIIQLQPQRYADDFRQVGLIGTLLSGSEIKNLLLNFPEPTSLSQAITQQLVVTTSCLSFVKRNEQLQGGNPLRDLLHRHRMTTTCRWKLIKLEPRH